MSGSPIAKMANEGPGAPQSLLLELSKLYEEAQTPLAFLQRAVKSLYVHYAFKTVALYIAGQDTPIALEGAAHPSSEGLLDPPAVSGGEVQRMPLNSLGKTVGTLLFITDTGARHWPDLPLVMPLLAGAIALIQGPELPVHPPHHQFLHWMGETLAEGVIVTDDEGRLRYVNQRAQRELELDQTLIERLSLTGLFASHQRANNVMEAIETHGEFAGLVKLRRRQGIMQAAISAVPLSTPEGESLGVLWLLHDRTEAREAARERRRVNQLATVGHLAAGTAHELNNPLSGVVGFTQLLLEEDLPEDTLRYLQLILDQARRCQRVIRNLLLFGQVYPANKGPTEVADIVDDALEQGGYAWRAGHVRFSVELAEGLPLLHGDGELLQEALFNILRNSVDAMSDGGTVRIIGELLPMAQSPLGVDAVQLSVIDTGQGMSKRVRDRIFEPFFTTREVGQGAGLGLSIAYGIIAEHGGDIRVETVVWHGTTVRVILPVGIEGMMPEDSMGAGDGS